jgi:hypothetical protein
VLRRSVLGGKLIVDNGTIVIQGSCSDSLRASKRVR